MNVFRSSAAVVVLTVVKLSTSFISVAYLSRIISPSALGIYFLFFSVVSVVGTIGQMGIGDSIEKRISEGEIQSEIFSTGLLLICLLAAFYAILSLLLSPYIRRIIDINIRYLSLGLILYMFVSGLRWALNGYLAVEHSEFSKFIQKAGFLGFLVIGYSSGYSGVLLPISAFLLSRAVSGIYVLWKLPLNMALPSQRALQSILTFSRYSVIFHLSRVAYDRVDILLIGAFLTPAAVSAYEVAWQLSLGVSFVSSSLSSVLRPQISRWWAENEIQTIQSTISSCLTIVLILVIPALFGVAVLSELALRHFFTPEYVSASLVLVVLVGEKIPQSVANLSRAGLYGINRPRALMVISIILLASNVSLNLAFIPLYGILGAAFATLISACFTAISATWVLSNSISIQPNRSLLGWGTVVAVLMMAFIRLIVETFTVTSLGQLLVTIAAGAMFYAVGLCLSAEFRQQARSIVYAVT